MIKACLFDLDGVVVDTARYHLKGFGGMWVRNGRLSFAPFLPEKWNSYAFRINFRDTILEINVNNQAVCIENLSDKELTLTWEDQSHFIDGNKTEVKLINR